MKARLPRRYPVLLLVCMAFCLVLLAGCEGDITYPSISGPDTTGILAQYYARYKTISRDLRTIGKQKKHPCVYVTTLDGQDVVSEEEYVTAVIDVFNCPEEYRLTATAGIRVRGNSTVEENEKPYRIKFDEKQGMLGLHEGKRYKSWVLLRTYWNLAPDYMGFRLAEAIFEGNYYSSDCIYVNLYLNGASKGVYLLCEQNQAGEGRVDVYEPKKDENGPEIGYLVEMDNYASDEHPFFTIPAMPEVADIIGVSRPLPARDYSIKSDVRSSEQTDYIARYVDGVFRILYEAAVNGRPMKLDGELAPVDAEEYGTAFEAVDAVMDLESLANMVILEELVQNYDVGAGSFFMAVDFSQKSIYKRLTFLAPWDFNWAYYEDPDRNYYACTFQEMQMETERSNSWYILAMKLDGFRRIVKEKWKKLSESGVLEEVADQVALHCATLEKDLGENAVRVQKAANIGDFVKRRIRWLDSQWLE